MSVRKLAKRIEEAIKAVPNAIKDAIEQVKSGASDLLSGNLVPFMNFGILILTGLVALFLILDMGPKFSFAGVSGSGGPGKRKKKSSSTRKNE